MEISNPSIPLSVGRHNNQCDNHSTSPIKQPRKANILPDKYTDVQQLCAEEYRSRHTTTQISKLVCLEAGDFVSRLDEEFTSSSLSYFAEGGTPFASSTKISSSPSQDLGPPVPYYDLNSKPGRKGKRPPPPSLKTSAKLDKPHAF